MKEAKCEKGSVIVDDRGNSETIKYQNMLLVKPTAASDETNSTVAQSIDEVKESLKENWKPCYQVSIKGDCE